jgi:hypothetical protein
MCRFLLLAVSLLAGVSSYGSVWKVDITVGNDGNEGNLDNPFRTLQTALQRAVSGDTVWLSGGTYEVENESFIIDKSLTVIGESNETVILKGRKDNVSPGIGAVRTVVVVSAQAIQVKLKNIIIEEGQASYLPLTYHSELVYPREGGGLYNASNANTTLEDVTVRANIGSVSNDEMNIEEIHGGGGISNHGTLIITGTSVIEQNVARISIHESVSDKAYGGGIFNGEQANGKGAILVIEGNTIIRDNCASQGNIVGLGGGIYNAAIGSRIDFFSGTIVSNVAHQGKEDSESLGGGIYNKGIINFNTDRCACRFRIAYNKATANGDYDDFYPKSTYTLIVPVAPKGITCSLDSGRYEIWEGRVFDITFTSERDRSIALRTSDGKVHVPKQEGQSLVYSFTMSKDFTFDYGNLITIYEETEAVRMDTVESSACGDKQYFVKNGTFLYFSVRVYPLLYTEQLIPDVYLGEKKLEHVSSKKQGEQTVCNYAIKTEDNANLYLTVNDGRYVTFLCGEAFTFRGKIEAVEYTWKSDKTYVIRAEEADFRGEIPLTVTWGYKYINVTPELRINGNPLYPQSIQDTHSYTYGLNLSENTEVRLLELHTCKIGMVISEHAHVQVMDHETWVDIPDEMYLNTEESVHVVVTLVGENETSPVEGSSLSFVSSTDELPTLVSGGGNLFEYFFTVTKDAEWTITVGDKIIKFPSLSQWPEEVEMVTPEYKPYFSVYTGENFSFVLKTSGVYEGVEPSVTAGNIPLSPSYNATDKTYSYTMTVLNHTDIDIRIDSRLLTFAPFPSGITLLGYDYDTYPVAAGKQFTFRFRIEAPYTGAVPSIKVGNTIVTPVHEGNNVYRCIFTVYDDITVSVLYNHVALVVSPIMPQGITFVQPSLPSSTDPEVFHVLVGEEFLFSLQLSANYGDILPRVQAGANVVTLLSNQYGYLSYSVRMEQNAPLIIVENKSALYLAAAPAGLAFIAKQEGYQTEQIGQTFSFSVRVEEQFLGVTPVAYLGSVAFQPTSSDFLTGIHTFAIPVLEYDVLQVVLGGLALTVETPPEGIFVTNGENIAGATFYLPPDYVFAFTVQMTGKYAQTYPIVRANGQNLSPVESIPETGIYKYALTMAGGAAIQFPKEYLTVDLPTPPAGVTFMDTDKSAGQYFVASGGDFAFSFLTFTEGKQPVVSANGRYIVAEMLAMNTYRVTLSNIRENQSIQIQTTEQNSIKVLLNLPEDLVGDISKDAEGRYVYIFSVGATMLIRFRPQSETNDRKKAFIVTLDGLPKEYVPLQDGWFGIDLTGLTTNVSVEVQWDKTGLVPLPAGEEAIADGVVYTLTGRKVCEGSDWKHVMMPKGVYLIKTKKNVRKIFIR